MYQSQRMNYTAGPAGRDEGARRRVRKYSPGGGPFKLAWNEGCKEVFYPLRKTYAQTLGD